MTLGDVSRWLNRMTGGKPGTSLCWRWAMSRGPYSRLCQIIDWALGSYHCRNEMSAADFIEWKRKRR